MQLDRAAELGALRGRIDQRQQGEGVGRKVRFRDRRAAAVHRLAVRPVFDHGAIGIAGPAAARRHDIAVRVERDGRAVAKAMPHDEVGRALHAGGLQRSPAARRRLRP